MDSKIEVLIKAKPLSRIPYSDKPLPQNSEIIYLTSEEYEKKFGCKYSESLMGDRNTYNSFLNNRNLHHHILQNKDLPEQNAMLHRLANPLDYLVICKINEQVGHGLFTNKDIPPNTILCIYSGIYETPKPYSGNNDYHYRFAHREVSIDGQYCAGISRFMQHLPISKEKHKAWLKKGLMERMGPIILQKKIDLDEFINSMMPADGDDEFENLKLMESEKNTIAVSNVTPMEAVIDNVPVILIIAMDLIKKGSQIGFSYGPAYWASCQKQPCYFSTDGTLLKPFSSPVPSIKGSTNILFSNPVGLYQQAVKEYSAKHYQEAILLIRQSLVLFTESRESNVVRFSRCYSTLASCYRELGDFEYAVKCCEQALAYCAKGSGKAVTEEIATVTEKLEKIRAMPGDHGKNFVP